MYKKRLFFLNRFTREFEISTTVYKNGKEIGTYKKMNGTYTVWVKKIGRLENTFKTRKETFKALKDNYELIYS